MSHPGRLMCQPIKCVLCYFLNKSQFSLVMLIESTDLSWLWKVGHGNFMISADLQTFTQLLN